MKRMILAGIVAAAAWTAVLLPATEVTAQPIDCSLVRCEACPAGYEPAPTPTDCCRCKLING